MSMRFAILCLLLPIMGAIGPAANAQDREDLMFDVMSTAPGKERCMRLVQLAAEERAEGRTRFAIEFAILASAEAKKHGLEKELAIAQLELARAHFLKGDLENTVKACVKVSRLRDSRENGTRNTALLQLADVYVYSGHPQKAMEYLRDDDLLSTMLPSERPGYLRASSKAQASMLAPADFIDQCSEMLQEVLQGEDKLLKLELLSMLASSQAKAGKNEEALGTEQSVLALAMELDRPMEAGICANNIGELNQRLGRPDAALKAYAQGMIMVEDVPQLLIGLEANAAIAHGRHGDIDIGMRLIDQALQTARKEKIGKDIPKLLRTKAALGHLQGDLEIAMDNALAALQTATEMRSLDEQVASCSMVAALYEQNGLNTEAKTYERKHRELLLQLDDQRKEEKLAREAQLIRLQQAELEQMDELNKDEHKESYLRQLTLDAENHEKQLALLIYEKQLEASAHREAELAKDQAQQALELAQATLAAERQQRKIQDLEIDRMLHASDIAKFEAMERERERHMELLSERALTMEARGKALEAESKQEKSRKRFYISLAVGAFILSIILLVGWISTRRKKRTIWQQNQQIRRINEILAEKDQDIQSSLSYARTIQSAILPTEQMLRSVVPESFILYRPLDQVSGDLPFLKHVGNTVYLAAIDCTGHGVPAAMMTFIAYYGLSELIEKDPDASSARLLDRLHLHVKNTMGTRGDGALYNDGMDIGLCKYEKDTGRLTFSGAQLSLFLVRNGSVTRYKGDILPIGDDLFDRKNTYRDHVVELLPGDTVFLFSDGIIHQFGGPEGSKKFSLKRLNRILEGASTLDLTEVKDRTERSFEDWKGGIPQTDDVLLIGLRYAA